MSEARVVTHEVFNQSAPLVDANLFTGNRALQDALRFNRPGFDPARFAALGAQAGSAAVQRHARLANSFSPQLKSHDRFGRRIDEVEFHPSYHALMAAAMPAFEAQAGQPGQCQLRGRVPRRHRLAGGR